MGSAITAMTVEYVGNILRRKPVDGIIAYKHFWGDTQKPWTAQGYLKETD